MGNGKESWKKYSLLFLQNQDNVIDMTQGAGRMERSGMLTARLWLWSRAVVQWSDLCLGSVLLADDTASLQRDAACPCVLSRCQVFRPDARIVGFADLEPSFLSAMRS
jgi:hypothetical protein